MKMKIIIIIILDCASNVNGRLEKKYAGFGKDELGGLYITGSGVYPIFLMSS
jgi:hypothetical protein